eukprot:100385-Chlamydomonas_euryale.AAC.23
MRYGAACWGEQASCQDGIGMPARSHASAHEASGLAPKAVAPKAPRDMLEQPLRCDRRAHSA